MKGKKLLTLVGLCLVAALVLPLLPACTEPAPEKYIILGAPLSLGYPDGICAKDNFELAIDEINDAGGVTVGAVNYKFKLESGDTRDLEPGASLEQALAVVEYLLTSKDADFIIGGPIRSDIALSAMDLASQYETVFLWSAGFLSPSYGPKVAGDYEKYKYCFRTQGSAVPQAGECVALLEQIAADEGLAKEAYIMCQQVSHAIGAANGIKTGLEDAGWTVHGPDQIPTGTINFDANLLAANATGAPFLVPWFDMPESTNLIKQWYDWSLPMIPVGFVVPGNDALAWNTFGGKCEYLVDQYPKAGITPINSQAIHYIDLYKAEINPAGPAETWVGPVCYQAVYILKEALESAGSLDADDVIAALEAMDSVGVYGRIKFDADHDMTCSQDPDTGAISTWVQWIDGERVNVYPEVVKTADVVLPPWM